MVSLKYTTCLEALPSGRDLDTYSIPSIQARGDVFKELDDPLSARDGSAGAVCIKWIGLDMYPILQVWENEKT